MVETTKLIKEESRLIKADNKLTCSSAKTTIPRAILNQWNANAGDILIWENALLEETGELVVIVRPEISEKLKKVKLNV